MRGWANAWLIIQNTPSCSCPLFQTAVQWQIMRVPMHTKSVLTDYTRTLHLRELDIKTRRIMSLAYKFSSKTLHLVDASCINLYWHEAHAALWQGTRTERSSQASRCPAVGTCVILLSSAASRLTALTLFCTSQSCLNKLGFHSNCLSVKTTPWHCRDTLYKQGAIYILQHMSI